MTAPVSISLKKGENVPLVSLRKDKPLSKVEVTLRWGVRTTTGEDFDPDAVAVVTGDLVKPGTSFNTLLNNDPKNFIYAFNNAVSADGAVVHSGDDRTGDGSHVDGGKGIEGGGEMITVDLDALDPDATHVYFIVSIDEADARKQNFGQIAHCSITVDDAVTGDKLLSSELDEDYAKETAMVLASIYRDGKGGWKFKKIEQGYASGLSGIVEDFGMHNKDAD